MGELEDIRFWGWEKEGVERKKRDRRKEGKKIGIATEALRNA